MTIARSVALWGHVLTSLISNAISVVVIILVALIMDAIRALLAKQPVGNDIWIALTWCLGILIVAYLFAIRAYKRKVA